MAPRSDHLKDALVEKVAVLTRERLDSDTTPLAEQLLQAYSANMAPDDLLHREPEALYGAVLSLLAFARQRPLGKAKLRIFQPRPDESGWLCPHSVIEIVTDDMPFIVDSITAALQRKEVGLHLVVHPVLTMRRDAKGKLLEICNAETDGARRESLIHVEIDRQPPETTQTLADHLIAILDDVRSSVEDWPSMRERLRLAIGDLASAPPGVPQDEMDEARNFLQWLYDDHFTLLGWREVKFLEDDDGQTDVIAPDPDSGLGLLRQIERRIFDEERDLAAMPPEVRAFLRRPRLLLLTKADQVSTVHRSVPLDIIGIKRFDPAGRVIGIWTLVGLLTATAYTWPPLMIPMLRWKVRRIIEQTDFPQGSHDSRALQAILENFPRDELLQADEAWLFDTTLAILRLQERQRLALFVRREEFDRFVSALVYIPRDRYDTRLREQIHSTLEEAFAGTVTAWYTQLAESPLARLHLIIRTHPGHMPDVDVTAVETRLAELARSWSDRLREALIEESGEDQGLAQYRRWGQGFPMSYRENASPHMALFDIRRIDCITDEIGLHLYHPVDSPDNQVRFKIYRRGEQVPLSDVLPLFEHMGFRVLSEEPHCLRSNSDDTIWLHDFSIATADGSSLDIEPLRDRLEEAFRAIWQGQGEDDGFNRLVVNAGLRWRQVMVLRAYSKYLRQAGSTFSQAYVEKAVVGNPAVAALLVQLFEIRFQPAGPNDGSDLQAQLAKALEAVVSADEDRILRRFLNLIECTLRTNYFQTDMDGGNKSYLSVKLDSQKIIGLPLPRPMVEIFVYSPRMEGVHLRGGKVARGGIRWSDRPEDFRSEILGLVKAQMVKNAVIVPIGSKGGFVVKRPPVGGSREAVQEEGIACYKTLMHGLLDITDNLVGDTVVPPTNVVRYDGNDPYLVVAADKGTATFSDIANGISLEYGFWIGDGFASGGSRGYDHKAMGITARGAWESVKRHFREIGVDIQNQDFITVGVGDMSGDVFGNGMLLSRHTKLVAAFDHRHIFLDPDPDPEQSFDERARLFALPRSSWGDYEASKISAGGGIFPRSAKSIPLTQEVKARFGIESDSLPPPDLIRALLTAPIDLLWFGGIGTYVKASYETNHDVGDRANEALRVDGNTLRCKVVGEGANLAMTQRGRIEYALAGGRLNTDAIDNSAGVDTSDHEVNIKILLDAVVADGDMTVKQRNDLLVQMTADVASLVLRDNYLQTQTLTLFEANAPLVLNQQERFMQVLERSGRLNREVEFLPTDAEMTRRIGLNQGLTRPEVAVVMAYGKLWLKDALLNSDFPDDPLLLDDLVRYFPKALQGPEWRPAMQKHRLRREIIATVTTNSLVNRIGSSFVARLVERTGNSPADVARAYLVVREAFRLREVWHQIESLDTKVPAKVQTAMLVEANRLIQRGIIWVLSHAPRPLDIQRWRNELEPGVETLRDQLDHVLPEDTVLLLQKRTADYEAQGVPHDLAERVSRLIVLASANDIARIAARANRPLDLLGRAYFQVGTRFSLGWLRSSAEKAAGHQHWQIQATDAVIDDLYERQAAITTAVATECENCSIEDGLAKWIDNRRTAVDRTDQLLAELKAVGKLDLAALIVASHQFRGLTEGN